MPVLSQVAIRDLLTPFFAPLDAEAQLSALLVEQVSTYLDLLIRWNSKISLTSIRDPEEMVRRHFGESLFTGLLLAQRCEPEPEILDYGSGPGFPGVPIQLLLGGAKITLAESQAKKVAFLREIIRVLKLPTQVWPLRVDELPAGRRFDVVTMRAVEKMPLALEAATKWVAPNGWFAALLGRGPLPGGLGQTSEEVPIPGSEHRRVVLWRVDKLLE